MTFTPAFIIIPMLFIITKACIKSTFAFTRFISFYVSCFFISWLDWMLWHSSFLQHQEHKFCVLIIHIVATTTGFTCFNAKRIKHRLITIKINNLWFYFTFLSIDIQLNKFTLVKDKRASPVKRHIFPNFITLCYFFSSNNLDWNCIIINTKIINKTIKSSFFILSTEQSFEMFPRHNGLATISESFALNL